MKKILIFLSIILIIGGGAVLTVMGFKPPEQIQIKNTDNMLIIGDTVKLKVTKENKFRVLNRDILWYSSNPMVVAVSKNGVITVNGEGNCEIVARYKNDLSKSVTYSIAYTHKASEPIEEKRTDLEKDDIGEDLFNLVVAFGSKYGKTIFSSNSLSNKKLVDLPIFQLGSAFFGTDNYWFSYSVPRYKVEDGIVYTIADWTNRDCDFSLKDLSSTELYNSVINNIGEKDASMGKSYDDMLQKIKAELSDKMCDDSMKFNLDKMDKDYEYRVVIRADYSTITIYNQYSNGLLSGLGLALKDMATLNLSDLDKWSIEKAENEIFEIDNIRICVEYRKK